MSDMYLTPVLLIVAYWVVSGIYHVMDVYDLFPQYRLHTPAEVLKRNHVTRWEVFRDVVTQQVIQTGFAFFLAFIDEEATTGKEEYDIARWAQRIRRAQRAIPTIAQTIGLDALGLAGKLSASYPNLAGAISGGIYPWSVQLISSGDHQALVPAFAPWELLFARFIYYFAVQAIQFSVAMMILDAWQYFLHRAMHQNKWLYSTSANHSHLETT